MPDGVELTKEVRQKDRERYAANADGPASQLSGAGSLSAVAVTHGAGRDAPKLRGLCYAFAALQLLSPVAQWGIAFGLGGSTGMWAGLGVGAALTAVFGAVLVRTTGALLEGIRDLQGQASEQRARRGGVWATPESALRYAEVARLATTLAVMAQTLQQCKKFLPMAVMESVGASAEPDGNDETSDEEESDDDPVDAPEGEVTIVFTDIQSSTRLWEQCSEAMNEALSLHNTAIRRRLRSNNGYEVKTIGDAFMCAFSSPFSAVNFGLIVQEDLVERKWPKQLELCDAAEAENLPDGRPLWAGLRVRIGAHVGNAILEHNPLTDRADYRGPTVNKAARVEGQGQGGMLVITGETFHAIEPRLSDLGRPDAHDLGQRTLKGVKEPVRLYVLLPVRLKERWKSFGAEKKKESRPRQRRNSRKFIMTPCGMVECSGAPSDLRSPQKEEERPSVDTAKSGPQSPGGSPSPPVPPAAAPKNGHAQDALENSQLGRGMTAVVSNGELDLQAFGMPAQGGAGGKPSRRESSGPRGRTFSNSSGHAAPFRQQDSGLGGAAKGWSKVKGARGVRRAAELGLRRRRASVAALQLTTQRGPAAGGDAADAAPQEALVAATELIRGAMLEGHSTQGVVECAGGDGVLLSWNVHHDTPLHASQSLRFSAAMQLRVSALITCGTACGGVLAGTAGGDNHVVRMVVGKTTLCAQALSAHAAAFGTFALVMDMGPAAAQSPYGSLERFLRPADAWLDEDGATLIPQEPDLDGLLVDEEDNGVWDCLHGDTPGSAPGSPIAVDRAERAGGFVTSADDGDALSPLKSPTQPLLGTGPGVLAARSPSQLGSAANLRKSLAGGSFRGSFVAQDRAASYKRNFHGALAGSKQSLHALRDMARGEQDASGNHPVDLLVHKVCAVLEVHQAAFPGGQSWRVHAPWSYGVKAPMGAAVGLPPCLPPALSAPPPTVDAVQQSPVIVPCIA